LPVPRQSGRRLVHGPCWHPDLRVDEALTGARALGCVFVCVCVCVIYSGRAVAVIRVAPSLTHARTHTDTHTHTHTHTSPRSTGSHPRGTLVDTRARAHARTHAHTHTTWERTGSRPRGTLVDMEERARDRGERFWPLNELPAPGDIPANQQTVLLSVAVACVFTSDNAHCHSHWLPIARRSVM
jgi:hypothetical protein